MSGGVDLLRRAAALMRERAQAADDGPWVSAAQSSHADWYGLQSPFFALGNVFDRENAALIASMHPAVALAVADWLDKDADLHEALRKAGARGLSDDDPAFRVARAYLGEGDH